jgi:hypothetical protein
MQGDLLSRDSSLNLFEAFSENGATVRFDATNGVDGLYKRIVLERSTGAILSIEAVVTPTPEKRVVSFPSETRESCPEEQARQ